MEPTANLNMERYVFDIPTDDGIKRAIVESSGGCYSVNLDDAFLGTMWQHHNRGMQWTTEDQMLQGAYGEIIQTKWKSSETLEVIINPTADLEIFSTFLKNEVHNLVDFEEHLDLIIKKKDDVYFKIIGIN